MPPRLSRLIITLYLALPGVSLAAPTILVRGEATLRLGSVSYADGKTTVEGELQDAAAHRGLVRQPVRLILEHDGQRTERRTRSDAQGRFRFQLPLAADVYLLSLHFDGDRYYGVTTLGPQLVDVSKPTVKLKVDVPPHFDVSRRVQRLSLEAISGGHALAVPVLLYGGKRLLARLHTRADGPLRIALATSSLGRPGPLVLTFRFTGNAQLNPSTLQFETVLISPVRLELTTKRLRVSADTRIVVRGTIRDALGPVRGATVALQAMGRHATSVLSSATGRFRFELPARNYPPGTLDLRAEFTPGVMWRQAARSKTLTIEILAPRPIPFRRYALPALATALVLGLLLGWRLRGRFSFSRPTAAQVADSEASLGNELPPPLSSGLRVSSGRTLRQRDFGLSGTIWDPIDRRLIVGAEIALQGPEPQTLYSDDEGRFTIEDLPAAEYQLRVSHAGYVSETFRATIPHRGALRGLRVDLIPIRVRILEIYRVAALPLLPKPRHWARWTPRDLLRHLRQARRGNRGLEDLSRLLERAYWSPRPTTQRDLQRAEELAHGLDPSGHGADTVG